MYHPSKNLLIIAIKIQYLQIFVYNIIHVFIGVKILNSVVAIQSKSLYADSNIMDQGFLSKIKWIIFPGLVYASIDNLLGDRLFLANLIEIESVFNRPPNVDCFWNVKMCKKLGFSTIKTTSYFTDSGYSLLFNRPNIMLSINMDKGSTTPNSKYQCKDW